MGQLIDDLLSLSRVIRSDMSREPVDLSKLATQIATDLHQAYPDRQVESIVQPDLLDRGDSRLLQAILENLLSNAWKFTATRTHAKIEFGSLPRPQTDA